MALTILPTSGSLETSSAQTFIGGYVSLLFRKSETSSLKASLYSSMSQCLHCPKTCRCTSEKRSKRYQLVSRGIITSLRSVPGTEYYYSNLGYSILAAIVEKASGTSYE